jgi:hypothetical protein
MAASISTVSAYAQDTTTASTKEEIGELKGAVDGINETVLAMKTTLDALAKIKVSGYIQSQFQLAEAAGVSSFAGGDFAKGVRSRFLVRRGRFKLMYDNDLNQYVMEVDVTQNGVAIKDAYVWVKEPWLRTFALTTGAFYRPFGFEVSYSSGNRETPEQSRLFQTLFPGERELGAQFEITAENGPLSFFNLKAGVFNGVLNNANENDDNKDFIGRAGVTLPFEDQSLALDGGLSLYDGKVTSNSKFVESIDKTSPVGRYHVDSVASNAGNTYGRIYYGADLQLYYDLPSIGGLSLRGEYISGQQPGTAASNSFYNPGSTVTPLYMRNFRGWYITYMQNIGLKNQFLIKYDVLDPNSDVSGSEIGATGTNLTAADIQYSTLGLGWIYYWSENVKFVTYYDMPVNEKISSNASGPLSPFKEDVNDNVLTLRVQYKF